MNIEDINVVGADPEIINNHVFDCHDEIRKLKKEIARLEKLEDRLDALEAAGVDNWSGYDYAMELLNE